MTAGVALRTGLAPWCRVPVLVRLLVGWTVLVVATTAAGMLLVPAPTSLVGGFDAAVVDRVVALRSDGLTRAVWVTTQLASLELAIPVVVLVGLVDGLRRGRWETLVLPAVTVGGGLALSIAVKLLTWRDRPDDSIALIDAIGPAFPSGHVIRAVALTATFVWLASRSVSRTRTMALAALAAVAVVLVAAARVYLGAHWPSDVLVAIVAATVWTVWVLHLLSTAGRVAEAGIEDGTATSSG